MASVPTHRTATAQIGTINMPVYDDAIMNCVDPDIIQAHLITDILSDQLVDARLQLAMHLANRAEALRRAGSDAAYIEQMDAAIVEDRSRLAFLTENLTCWRDRLADLIAEQDADNKPRDQVATPQPPANLDPAEAAEMDRIMALLIAAATEFEITMSDLERSVNVRQMVEGTDGAAPDVSIGPTGGPTTDHGPQADTDQTAIQAREAAADRLLSGPLMGVLVGADSVSTAVEVDDK
jgi:hypothetical protein